MAEPLKTFFSESLVREIAKSIKGVFPAFKTASFVTAGSTGLSDLELLDRARHIAKALGDHLPADFEKAIAILVRSLGPEHVRDELEGAGMAPFFYLPHTMFIAERGIEHFDLAMAAQREITKRFTAEFSIRPFIERYPEKTFLLLKHWAKDENAHVRRLVSEGTRPRLPWAARVRYLDEHPEKGLSLLEMLKDDPATLVRRSVANHLNDVGKAHPELLLSTCKNWLEGASPERRALVEHALRSAIKRGEKGALALLGHGEKPNVAIQSAQFEPSRVAIGGKEKITFTLKSQSKKAQSLLVDIAVHFIKANGKPSAKVFKISRVTLEPSATVTLSKSISLAVHTTREPQVGIHQVDVLINGNALPLGSFEVFRSS